MESSRHASKVADLGHSNFILPPGNYLVKPDQSNKTVGGLVVPNTSVTRIGRLILSAQEKVIDFPDIPVGSTIYYLQTNSLEIVWNEETYLIIYYRDIRLAIPPDDAA